MSSKIKFLPKNIEIDIDSGKSVMEIAWEQGLFIQSSCKGKAICAECRVIVVEGQRHVLPPTNQELELIGQGYFIDQRRLSCQLYCFGNVTIDLSEQLDKEDNKNITKSFLKRVQKTEGKEIRSIRDNLIESDSEMKNFPLERNQPSGKKVRKFYNRRKIRKPNN